MEKATESSRSYASNDNPFKRARNRRWFIISTLTAQVILSVVYSLAGQYLMNDSNWQNKTEPERGFIEVMNIQNMLIGVFQLVGFGLLLIYFKYCTWSGLAFSLLFSGMAYQIYPLAQIFWRSAFLSGFNGQNVIVDPVVTHNPSIRCAVAMEVVLACIIGRFSIMQLLIIASGGVISCSLSDVISKVVTRARNINSVPIDVGGSIDIFFWAGIFGMTISYGSRHKYLDLRNKYRSIPQNDHPMLALLGTCFIWAGFIMMPHNSPTYQSNLDIASINVLLALTSSVITTFLMSLWIHLRLGIYQCIMSSITGGVIMGSSASIAQNPAIPLVVGSFSGILTYVLIHFVFQRMNKKWMVASHDIYSVFLISGVLGGFVSAAILGSYGRFPTETLHFTGISFSKTASTQDAMYQIIHIGVTGILSLLCGLLVSGLNNCFSKDNPIFCDDFTYFEEQYTRGEGGWEVEETSEVISSQVEERKEEEPVDVF